MPSVQNLIFGLIISLEIVVIALLFKYGRPWVEKTPNEILHEIRNLQKEHEDVKVNLGDCTFDPAVFNRLLQK